MAKFQLFLMIKNTPIMITDFQTNATFVINTGSYEEQLELSNYGAFTLSFKMAKFNFINGEKIENPLVNKIVHGSIIRLKDKNDLFYEGVVNQMTYSFTSNNIVISYTVNDCFSTELAKRNVGYNITEDATEDDYVGALTLDNWTLKIKKECKITWNYISVDVANAKIIRNTDKLSYNTLRSFSISNSNAYDTLKQLADTYGMDICVNYLQRSFYFIPLKNPLDKGFRLNPLLNLAALTLDTNSQSMVTVLNVTGQEDVDGNEITILGEIPPCILTWFNTEDWATSSYGKNMYQAYIEAQTSELTDTEQNFLETVYYVPWLENKIINLDYFKNSYFLTNQEYSELINFLYNDLRIVNGQLIYQSSQLLAAQTTTYSTITSFLTNTESLYSSFEAALENYLQSDDNSLQAFETFKIQYTTNRTELNYVNIYNRDVKYTNFLTYYNIALQSFYEAIYNFRSYWNATDTGTSTNGRYYTTNSYITDVVRYSLSINGIEKGSKTFTFTEYFPIPIPWSIGQRIRITAVTNYYMEGLITFVNANTVTINVDKISGSGSFESWVLNNVNYLNIVSQCASIKNNLTSYWEIAVTKGKYCGYWLPSDWDCIDIWEDDESTEIQLEWNALSFRMQTNFTINSNIVPIITIFIDNRTNPLRPSYITNTKLQSVNWTYSTTPLADNYIQVSQLQESGGRYYYTYKDYSTGVLIEYDLLIYVPDNVDVNSAFFYFSLNEKQSQTYYILTSTSVLGYTYTNIYNNLFSANISLFGIYGDEEKFVSLCPAWDMAGYTAAKKAHDDCWETLYNNYPNLILENIYEDSTATSSLLLLQAAQNKFLELSVPEPTYSLSMIDIYNVNGGEDNTLSITDQIHIEDNIIEKYPTEIKYLLSKALFVSGITYTLRSDAEIQLTVNPVRYGDVLLRRLAQLL